MWFSVMLLLKAFQLFHPMGGVGAGPGTGWAGRSSSTSFTAMMVGLLLPLQPPSAITPSRSDDEQITDDHDNNDEDDNDNDPTTGAFI
jgi:hypothetical protein